MARSVNKVTLLGNVGKDPEIRTTQAGKRIASITLATSETWKDKQTGEQKEQTEWHKVVVFNDGLAGVIERYVKKGSKLYTEGQLKTRKWQDQSGQDRYSTDVVVDQFNGSIVLCDRPESGGQSHKQDQREQPAPRQEPQRQTPQRQPEPETAWDDSDVPF